MSAFLFFMVFVLTTTSSLSAQPSQALGELVGQIVVPYTKDTKTHGLMVGIIHDGYFYKYAYGQLNTTDTLKPTSKTDFHIGAMTKVFTTSLLMTLVEANKVSLKDPMTKYLPDSVVQANPKLKEITLKQLATHTAGFPREPQNIALTSTDSENPYGNYQVKDLYRFLIAYELPVASVEKTAASKKKGKKKDKKKRKRKKGKKKHKKKEKDKSTSLHPFKYSHIGIALLGHLLENAAKDSYENLLNKYVLSHLDLTHTALQTEASLTSAKGHKFSGELATPLTYAAIPAAEGLHSTLDDLLVFTQANIEKAVHKELYTIFSKCHELQVNTDMRWVNVAYGWYAISTGKGEPDILTHSGRAGGFSNFIGFVKETKTAVVVLSNSPIRVDGIGLEILELINR